jgi:hypothetical protein
MKKFNMIYEETIVETQLNNVITEGIIENIFNFLKDKLNAIFTASADTAIGICKAITNCSLFKNFDISIDKEKLKTLITINEDENTDITIDDEKFKQFVVQTLNENNKQIEKIKKDQTFWNFTVPLLKFILKILVIAGIILAIYFYFGDDIAKIWNILKSIFQRFFSGERC